MGAIPMSGMTHRYGVFFNGDMPPHGIAPLSRVIRVGQRAWPMARLQGQGVIREAGVTIEKIGV